MDPVIEAVSRFVQLTWEGNELRGECPGCGTGNLYVTPGRNRWACYGCNCHDAGDSAEAFACLAKQCGLPEREPRHVPERKFQQLPRWERVTPPLGAYPDLAPQWLGEPLAVHEQRDSHGKLVGVRAHYAKGEVRDWIYTRYSVHDPGEWRARRPHLRERVAMRHPSVPEEVAKYVQGRSRVSVTELLAGESPHSYRAKAIAFSLRALGWVRKREGLPSRRWYYVAQ